MATIVQDVLNIFYSIADLLEDDGSISSNDAAPYESKTPSIINMLQSELINQGDLYSTYEISNTPIENLLGETFDDIQEYDGVNELTFECAGSAKAYSFEVDGECTVYIEDYTSTWNTLATISVSDTVTDFTNYKGVVTPTSGATKSRIRLNGNYFVRLNNRALFSVALPASKVPAYRKWVKKSMPSDFKSVDQIVNEYPFGSYDKSSDYKWEGRSDLYIDYNYKGNIRIVYHPVPTAIISLTDTLQIDDVTARTILPYGLGAHLLFDENSDMAAFFQQRYEELKAMATIKQPIGAEQIIDFYGVVMNGNVR